MSPPNTERPTAANAGTESQANAGDTQAFSHPQRTAPADALKFYNDDLKYVAEPGEFRVMVGGNSRGAPPAHVR